MQVRPSSKSFTPCSAYVYTADYAWHAGRRSPAAAGGALPLAAASHADRASRIAVCVLVSAVRAHEMRPRTRGPSPTGAEWRAATDSAAACRGAGRADSRQCGAHNAAPAAGRRVPSGTEYSKEPSVGNRTSELASRFPRNCHPSQPVSNCWKLPEFSLRRLRRRIMGVGISN